MFDRLLDLPLGAVKARSYNKYERVVSDSCLVISCIYGVRSQKATLCNSIIK